MTTCPKVENAVPISKTVSPVTQVAEVAVNKAFRKGILTPFTEDIGKDKRKVPSVMIRKKPMTKILAGVSILLVIFFV